MEQLIEKLIAVQDAWKQVERQRAALLETKITLADAKKDVMQFIADGIRAQNIQGRVVSADESGQYWRVEFCFEDWATIDITPIMRLN